MKDMDRSFQSGELSTFPESLAFTPARTNTPAAKHTFLMCKPTLYDVSYIINPWMSGNLGKSIQVHAMQQWQSLYDTLSRHANVALIEPVPGSPDMVFTANAGLARDGYVAISSFFHPERQAEEQHFRRWFTDAGYKIVNLARETPFEGEGDALFSADGSRLWVGYGTRTRKSSHATLREVWHVEVTSLHLIDPRFYHLDTCFAPLEDGSLLYYPAAFDKPSQALIESFYSLDLRIAVTEADALRFACNAVNIDQTIVLNGISPELEATLQTRGFNVIQVQLDEFLKAGGAAKCLVMKLTPGLAN
jgi:N-dimethylarginine dimethylaminohydrolase